MSPRWALVAAAAALLAVDVAAAQPPPVDPGAPPAAPAPASPAPAAPAPPGQAALRAFDREIDRACFRRLGLPALVERIAALRAAGHEQAALYRDAPEAMLALARLHRQGGDAQSAIEAYDGLAAAADESRRRELARERAAMSDEQALLAAGVARPEAGALLATLREAPGPGGPYRIGVWVVPDCTPFASGDGRSLLALYRQEGSALAAVGRAIAGTAGSLALEDEGWGSDMTGDGRRVLTVLEANGGNCWACTRLRLYVAGPDGLAELPVEAPDFVVPQAVVSVADRRVLVASDVRWEAFGDVCHACAPGVPVVLAWRSARFEPACRDHPGYYRQRLAELGQGLADRDPQFRFGAVTSRLLIRVQLGEAEPAWREYRRALVVVRRLRGGPRGGFRGAEMQLEAALRAARPALAGAACPVNVLALR